MGLRLPRWIVAVCLCLVADSLPAQSTSNMASGSQPSWQLGYNGFRMLLEERGLTVRMDAGHTLSKPRESVIVMLGDLSRVPREEWLRLRRYVAQGGSLLVASERAFKLSGVSQFSPGPVTSLNEADHYQGFSDCIELTLLNSDHPMTRGLRRIIVNKSGWLSPPEDESLDWKVLASLSQDCLPGSARGKAVLMAGMDPNPDRGVLILSADQSLFSDGMLWHGDNSILAIQTTDVLCRGNRKWLTVFDSGRPLPSYQQPPPVAQIPPVRPIPPPQKLPSQLPPAIDPPEPSLETMLKVANKVIEKVEESNILNETLRDRPRNVRPVAWLRTVLLILAVLFTLFVLWRLVQNRWHLTPARHLRFMQSMYGVQSSRQLEASEFGPAVEVLSQELCRDITGTRVEAEWLKLLGEGRSPAVAALPRSLRKGLAELTGIATRGCRIHISRKKFQAIGAMIDELRKIHRVSPLVKLEAAAEKP